jgi:BirA family biotin operon repressor/biotin-[acetyl-CoA-carboxylase] ligase
MLSIGASITILQSVESTNNYAMAKVHAGLAKHGETWLALEQTAGKGQRGKAWQSAPGDNIIFTTVLKPDFLSLDSQVLLSRAVALACYDFFYRHAGDETKLKLPNDLYWRDRKAGGILIENVFRGSDWSYAVVGIGININQVQFDPALPNPVSLKQITGKTFDIMVLSKELCEYLEKRYRQLEERADSVEEDFGKVPMFVC